MKRIVIVNLLLISINSVAQDDPQKIIDNFFGIYTSKGVDNAIDYIFSTNKWMKESKDQIENIKFKLNTTSKQLGDFAGYYLMAKKTIGDHLVLYTFIIRYDRQPLRFTFLFYKPTNSWRLQNFSYDDSIDDELEEAAKAYRLKENLDY